MRRDFGIPIAGSTACRILQREGVSRVYRYQKCNEHTKRYSAENPLNRVQTDSGVEFTNRLTSRRRLSSDKAGIYALFEQFLFRQPIPHRLIRVRTPEHNRKVERFNATLKRVLQRRARHGLTLHKFQALIDQYLEWYNRRRPHWSLNGLTPHERFYGIR